MNPTIERAVKGEREAMGKLVAEFYPSVYRFCAHRVGPELAQDAAQETFITAQSSLTRFQQRSSFLTWLLGIAHNHCRNMARKRKLEISFDSVWKPTGQADERGIIDRQALRSALASLTKEHRESVVMHEVEGLTYDEIAVILEIPVGTVKSRLNAAFSKMRERLSEAGKGAKR